MSARFDSVREVRFERVGDTKMVRMIAFDRDEETGALSVADIYESGLADPEYKFVARVAADYTVYSNTSVEYGTYVDNEYTTLDQIDTGKARKLQSKLQRMIQTMMVV
jgi:hypothetical protein